MWYNIRKYIIILKMNCLHIYPKLKSAKKLHLVVVVVN